jgi:hypothetical protein
VRGGRVRPGDGMAGDGNEGEVEIGGGGCG